MVPIADLRRTATFAPRQHGCASVLELGDAPQMGHPQDGY
jgi:hypothetical protein